jgi:hypothetical protein
MCSLAIASISSGRRNNTLRKLGAAERMRPRRAIPEAPNVQNGALEIDLIPAQVDQLADPQTMPETYPDRGRITMPMAGFLSRLDQLLDLRGGEVLARQSPRLWRKRSNSIASYPPSSS